MSPTVNVSSSADFSKILSSSSVVIADFYADWCGPCKAIAPTYESLSTKHSKPNKVTFTKVNVDHQQDIARQYGVSAMPTFLIFHKGTVIETIRGATPKLTSSIEKAVQLAGPGSGNLYASPGRTLGGSQPQAQRPSMSRAYNPSSFIDTLIAFFALYFTTLFSLDAHKAAEDSPFNIHKRRSEPSGLGARSAAARGSSGSSQSGGRKLGTIADISGGN